MDPISITLVAVGLAMDAFTVSICSGLQMETVRLRWALRIAAFFGIFQALMPVLGWLSGVGLRQFIQSFDHWIAFGLLALIGGHMIYETLRGEDCRRIDPTNLLLLLGLAVATSIDAFAVGLSFAFLGTPIAAPTVLFGVVTFALSLCGVFAGQRFGNLLQGKVEVVGGLVLIGIGAKILIEHLSAAAPALALAL